VRTLIPINKLRLELKFDEEHNVPL